MPFVADRLKELIAEMVPVGLDRITLDSRFIEDLGCDSLDLLELLMAAEEEFDIEISDEDAEKLTTVGKAVSYLEKMFSRE